MNRETVRKRRHELTLQIQSEPLAVSTQSTSSLVYINLERDHDRRQRCHAIGIQPLRFCAVDGATHTFSPYEQNLFRQCDYEYTACKGLACSALSHMRVWEALLLSRDQYWIVCEDDVIVNANVTSFSTQTLPDDFLCSLLHNQTYTNADSHQPMQRPRWCDQGSRMYALTPSAAAHLIRTVLLHGFRRAVDWVIIDQCWSVPMFLSWPTCGTCDDNGISSIHTTNEMKPPEDEIWLPCRFVLI